MSPFVHEFMEIVIFLGLLLLFVIIIMMFLLIILFIIGGILQWRENRKKANDEKMEI